jgi:hypothetical protein
MAWLVRLAYGGLTRRYVEAEASALAEHTATDPAQER